MATTNRNAMGLGVNKSGPTVPAVNQGATGYDPGFVNINNGVLIGTDKLTQPDNTISVKTGMPQQRYSTGLLVHDSETKTISELEDTINRIASNKWPSLNGNMAGVHRPLINCNTGDNHQDYLADYHKLNPRTYREPIIRWPDGSQMSPIDADALRTGTVVNAVVSFYPYETRGKGVACRLESLTLTGERVSLVTSDNDSDRALHVPTMTDTQRNSDHSNYDFLN